jgi:hypothetical protein
MPERYPAMAPSYAAVCAKALDARATRVAWVTPPVALQLGQHLGVVRGVDHDGDARVVLRGGAHHRRAADVNLLDQLVVARARAPQRLLEGVEVDHHEVDGRAADGGEGLAVVVQVAHQDRRVDAGWSVLTRPSMISGEPV